jgi:hypothetical protein
MSFHPLNPQLYQALQSQFGQIKVEKAGQRMIRHVRRNPATGYMTTDIQEAGETYRVDCPRCNDQKRHLYVNHAFGTKDPGSHQRIKMAICFRCGNATELVENAIRWQTTLGQRYMPEPISESEAPQDPYRSPGWCLRLDQHLQDPTVCRARQYLAERNIDPDFAGYTYGVSACVQGNPDLWGGAMAGRIIVPVMHNNQHVGWQARMIGDPDQGAKRSLANLRWVSMPGSGWRSKHLVGFAQAYQSSWLYLVEGPTDMLKQGPPCVGSLGQTLSHRQVSVLAQEWPKKDGGVVVVGDAQKEGGQELTAQRRSVKMLLDQLSVPVYLCPLPHGDPGDWSQSEFFNYVAEYVRHNPPEQAENKSLIEVLQP